MEVQRVTKIALIGLALAAAVGTPALSFQPVADETEEVAVESDSAVDEVTTENAEGGDAAFDAAMSLGEDVYTDNCAVCHGADGSGPERPLVGNANLEYAVVIASQVIHGTTFMPRFPELSDEEVAAVGTYIRNSWGNDMGPVSAEEIAEYR